jgi:hypothetical protein
VADVEWSKAFNEVAATGLPSQMARMALLECAARSEADCASSAHFGAGGLLPHAASQTLTKPSAMGHRKVFFMAA